ncbi:MAG: hypothetical protein BA861_09540 [Desulfobacterales bacterium S3730MH5]|nr:MAG: hypothetical protein BA861_09540 [Desulfobacterales bacterium S3730MH5]OEU80669.1 MAG: hypothetical protein BA873_13260 [Desulfobulbaceae bacterium C00003063]OEU80985.1 MAG: hypothetical protein BA865_13095 [Desulfobacterales bacterium S5133MH4]
MTTPDKTEIAVWRYGIISRLLHRNEEEESLNDELLKLAAHSFRRPDGRTVSFSGETMRKWLYRYRHGGLPALGDAPRKDQGTHGSVSKTIAKRLAELREEHPRWTLARMLGKLIDEKLWNMVNPSRATLYRFGVCAYLPEPPTCTGILTWKHTHRPGRLLTRISDNSGWPTFSMDQKSGFGAGNVKLTCMPLSTMPPAM